MAKLSKSGKVFVIVGALIAFTACTYLWNGNYWVGGFMVAVAAFEFYLAHTSRVKG